MVTREQIKERSFRASLAPSLLAHFCGIWPSELCGWLAGRREFSEAIAQKISDTLAAAEELQKRSPAPIAWKNVDAIRPLILPLRREIEHRRLCADAEVELDEQQHESFLEMAARRERESGCGC